MPKIMSNKKKELARMRIRKKTERLIEQIGFKNVTITKICGEVPIGKGTFYYYYSSKELLLYEIIKEKEENLMNQILSYTSEDTTIEEKVIKVLTDVYIGTGSIVSIVTAEELEKVIEKLPRELLHEKHLRGRNFFESSMKV